MKQTPVIRWMSILIFSSLLGAEVVWGAELFEMNTSVRALGMGNAYTTVVDDKDALFYNPSGLGKVEGLNLTIMDPRIGVDGQDVVTQAQNMRNTTGFADSLRGFFGKKLWLGGGGKTAFTSKGFGIALYDSLDASGSLSNPAYPNFNINFVNDLGGAAGIAFDLMPGFTFGVAGKRMTRVGARVPIGVDTLASLSSTDLQNRLNNRGTGYSLDGSIMFTLPTPVKPTLTFVWKDIGTTSFTKDEGAQAPPRILDEQIFGFGMDIDATVLHIRPAFDFKYLNRVEEQLGKKIHLGVEFSFPIVDLRVGLHQGYYTLGAGVDLEFIRLDAATYGVELGEYPGQEEDRRYMLQLTMELGFDPDFNFLGGGSANKSSRGIKKRR